MWILLTNEVCPLFLWLYVTQRPNTYIYNDLEFTKIKNEDPSAIIISSDEKMKNMLLSLTWTYFWSSIAFSVILRHTLSFRIPFMTYHCVSFLHDISGELRRHQTGSHFITQLRSIFLKSHNTNLIVTFFIIFIHPCHIHWCCRLDRAFDGVLYF